MIRRFLLLAAIAAGGLLSVVEAQRDRKTVAVKVRVNSQASGYEGWRAMDGNPSTLWHTLWGGGEPSHPHEIVVDLGSDYSVSGFAYLPRPGGSNGTIGKYECLVSTDGKSYGKPVAAGTFGKRTAENVVTFDSPVKARYVKLRALSEVTGKRWASIAELRILVKGVTFRAKKAGTPLLVQPNLDSSDELKVQFAALQRDIANRNRFEPFRNQAFHPQATVLESDRDPVDIALRRTTALLEDLEATPSAPDLAALGSELASLKEAAAGVDVGDKDARLALFRKICGVRRKIAFSNPLLDFDTILFIKRHRPGFNHMCDQYYGINAKPGGGVFVLSDPFGEKPVARDLLADATVQRGRLEGQKLEGGSFLSPDLSYDARRIAFAYVECTGDTAHRHHTDPTRGRWHEGRSYHVFKVNADGSGLEQLTDGTWNDFDPCWLPNGRIALITERRGGYLRCGRVCPTYTLFDMADDGSSMRCLSYHETNEWHPSVTHDGRIIYTRWDYVDRHGCTAHMPWITTADGRDSRAVHGNFAPRKLRPDMELDCRAIPNSLRFVATAAPHHGQAYGSLVVLDQGVPDDDEMGPIRRLTPEVGFPESQGGAQVYGTPWPLSEKYYLCAYDAWMQPGVGRQGRGYVRGNYGLYLIDAFGNKELIYRDPAIACQSPIPFVPRPMPPAVPEKIAQEDKDQRYVVPKAPGEKAEEGTVTVIDVYESMKPWPEGTKITALRVVQILPMSVPSGRPPHEIGFRLPSAKDSVNLARYVLGTVPVEKDGSSHFTVPIHKEIFFQALDERGLAVQSMRSSTYLQAGEHLVCAGCHDRRHITPRDTGRVPLALRRSPSRLKPDVEGSNPFSYARLVQPVLDRKCVTCHAEHPDKPINLGREPYQKKWYASYVNLTKNYGFWNYGDGYRTTPGRFGARASKLLKLLDEGHHDVKLSEEEFHRITLWLDLSSLFYGVYEKEGGEAQLRGEVVRPTLE